MNIYILDATYNGKLMTQLLCSRIPIKGIIGLDASIGYEETPEYMNFEEFCNDNKINYISVNSYNLKFDDDKNKLLNENIELLLIGSWQRLLPKWLISHCKIGVIGTHGSPEGISRGRGRSPQNWALLLGKKEMEMSIFWIDKNIDSGAVIDTRKYELRETDDIMTSYIKVNLLKVEMLIDNLNNGKISNHEGTLQTEEGFYLPKRIKADGMIDWNRSCTDIYNMIRALAKPYPGAFTVCNGMEFIIWQARPVNMDVDCLNIIPGTVVSLISNQALVKCRDGYILIQECTNMKLLKEKMQFSSADYNEQMISIINRHREKYDTPISEMILSEIHQEEL